MKTQLTYTSQVHRRRHWGGNRAEVTLFSSHPTEGFVQDALASGGIHNARQASWELCAPDLPTPVPVNGRVVCCLRGLLGNPSHPSWEAEEDPAKQTERRMNQKTRIVEMQGTCLELEGAERNGQRLMWLLGGRRPSSQCLIVRSCRWTETMKENRHVNIQESNVILLRGPLLLGGNSGLP